MRREGSLVSRLKRAAGNNLALLVILILFCLLAASYSVIVPLGEAPDEVPHFTYIRYIAEHHRL
ncbi:MAG: hypothetical protein MUP64_11160, partial [Anaerolineae bacterium]|nr:hypothetical protein [Anaerolineae bacterium]